MRLRVCVLAAAVVLTGCQLPERQVMPPRDQTPSFDAKAFVLSDGAIFAQGLARIPGSICLPNADGYCDAEHIYTTQYLKPGGKVSAVLTNSDPAAAYDSIIDSKYRPVKDYPFLVPAGDDEHLTEVKAYVLEKAAVGSGPFDGGANGFPGAAAVIAGLEKDHKVTVKAGTILYWITAAQLVSVTEDDYATVPSLNEVQGIGFGGPDQTYNSKGPTKQTAWLGIQALRIRLVLPTAPVSPDAAPNPADGLLAAQPEPVRQQIFAVDDTGKIKSSLPPPIKPKAGAKTTAAAPEIPSSPPANELGSKYDRKPDQGGLGQGGLGQSNDTGMQPQ